MPEPSPTPRAPTVAAAWLGLGTAATAAGLGIDALGLPSASLFGALLVGVAVALAAPGRFALPGLVNTGARAIVGVTLGAYVQASSLGSLAGSWLPVALVSLATLGISIACGVALSRATGLNRATATLGSVAGGASGIVAMAEELGADERLVAFMQYLRVLVVVVATPLIALVAFSSTGSGPPPGDGGALGTTTGWGLTAIIAFAGAALARRVTLPAGSLLAPLGLAGAMTLAAPDLGLAVPPLLREAGFALIGLQVGLRFTADTLREIGALAGPVLLGIVALMLACFGLAVLLAATSPATLLDAYLATTPGGLFAVVAAAFGTGADTTFIVAVQTIRLLVMVLLAPLTVRWASQA
jgi:uncharacterized protein